jgi:drug/metabolite transporter (DMT)-like permease
MPPPIPTPKTARLSPNATGAVWMLVSAACFTVMAASLKLLAEQGYSESQMVFARCAAGFLAILPFALRAGQGAWTVARPRPLFFRCAYSTLGFFAGFYAFAHMPLADAQAITFTRVLFIVVFAAWLLKEKVAWRRWTAVGVGFVGVLLMLRPEGAAFGLPALAAVISALFFGLAIITVKDLTRDHSTMSLVLYTNAFTTVFGLPFIFFGDWFWPDATGWVLLIVLGLSGVGAQSCYVRALSTGEASLMGLIDYVRLPLAIAVGFVVFHEVPDTLGMFGAAVIIGSTLYITWRESRIKARQASAEPTN